MKKIIVLLACIVITCCKPLQVSTINVAWDTVEPTVDSAVIKYELCRATYPDGITIWFPSEVIIPEASLVISFYNEVIYSIGVRTNQYLDDYLVSRSHINWSHINGLSTPEPFILKLISTDNTETIYDF